MLIGRYKLVKDKSINELKKKHDRVLYEKLNKKDLIYYLMLRLKEETAKLIRAKDKDRFIQKIADILETIDCLLAEKKIKKSEIEKVKAEQNRSKGKFDKRCLLISVEE